jgi:hypothetical protein
VRKDRVPAAPGHRRGPRFRNFFLIIIIPAIVAFFMVFGVFGSWAYRRTAHPLVGGIANAISFAWAIGVTFPLLAG